MVDTLLLAKSSDSDASLLSARYHVFLRSLEGAFVTYLPQKKVFLDRKARDQESAAFEVALCRECGQHYFVGVINNGKLVEAIRDPSQDDFGASFFRPIETTQDSVEEEDEENADKQLYYLCARCAAIGRIRPDCGHNNFVPVIKEEPPRDEDRADQLARCGACGYNAAGRDPVRELVHGADGPHAVIATTLFQSLPEMRKKVLAFADGRQEAAFFAWYLEDSYQELLSRNLILKTARRLYAHTSEGLSLRELATALRDLFREAKTFPSSTGDLELRHHAWLAVYREFLTDEPRISLEGVGLVHWFCKLPEWIKLPNLLSEPPWSLTENEAQDLLRLLLGSMRTDRGVVILTESGVSINWGDVNPQASPRTYQIGQPRGRKGIRSWDNKTLKRTRLLAKLLKAKGIPEAEAVDHAIKALRAIWESLRQSDEGALSSDDHLLAAVEDGRRLNPNWYRLELITDQIIYRCNTCNRLQTISVNGICPRNRCPGFLNPIYLADLEPNHYRIMYEAELPGSMRVEEHTAQLSNEKAREFQREFREGKIHVLSCSTTFELGVDLGNLDTIFLRDVPPEAFNYAQRVGRAGRRRGFPGFAITYCRRGPHDLYHFADPLRIMSGRVQAARPQHTQ